MAMICTLAMLILGAIALLTVGRFVRGFLHGEIMASAQDDDVSE